MSNEQKIYSPATVTIVSHSCDNMGNLSAEIQVVHTEAEEYDGGTCGEGLKVWVNGGEVGANLINAQNTAGTITETYEINELLNCGDPYTIEAQFFYVVRGSTTKKSVNGNCDPCC